jgi:hypothetical protein
VRARHITSCSRPAGRYVDLRTAERHRHVFDEFDHAIFETAILVALRERETPQVRARLFETNDRSSGEASLRRVDDEQVMLAEDRERKAADIIDVQETRDLWRIVPVRQSDRKVQAHESVLVHA